MASDSRRTGTSGERWPELPFAAWRETYETLHLWTQVVGKLTLHTTPLVNHWWNVAFHYAARGFATQPMTCSGTRTLVAEFDLVDHALRLTTSEGHQEIIALRPMTVADFHHLVMAAVRALGLEIPIWTHPVEIAWTSTPFEKDTAHRAYDAAWANALWRALDSMRPVFDEFRCGFVGKCSPLHFFWGSFDLALTRFSGRRAPSDPDAHPVEREAYSHEVISAGWWPGSPDGPDASFYVYARPEPDGFRRVKAQPGAAYYDPALAEFLLPYEAVRTAPSPEAALGAFLQSTYEGAATLMRWPREDLESKPAGN